MLEIYEIYSIKICYLKNIENPDPCNKKTKNFPKQWVPGFNRVRFLTYNLHLFWSISFWLYSEYIIKMFSRNSMSSRASPSTTGANLFSAVAAYYTKLDGFCRNSLPPALSGPAAVHLIIWPNLIIFGAWQLGPSYVLIRRYYMYNWRVLWFIYLADYISLYCSRFLCVY